MPRFHEQGCAVVCKTLEQMGIDTVFGIPGTQSIPLFEALRRCPLKVILPTTELAGAFMANGYYRVSGRPAVLVTIQGPGFTYAITGLAEARHDSVAMLHIVVTDDWRSNKAFGLQQIDHNGIALPIVKRVFNIDRAEDISSTFWVAYQTATSGEPGPVLILLSRKVLCQTLTSSLASDEKAKVKATAPLDKAAINKVANRLLQSNRVVLLVGQGGQEASRLLVELTMLLDAMVVTTCSGRGVIPEDDDHVLNCDFSLGFVDEVNTLFDSCDLIIAIGCKFSHNGTSGFRLKIEPEKLIHIDASAESLGMNYPASMAIEADSGLFLRELLALKDEYANMVGGFKKSERIQLRDQVTKRKKHVFKTEPLLASVKPSDIESFFDLICDRCKSETVFVTDAGIHQSLARNYLKILRQRGLVVPTDYQSMGFGLPAAIGAGVHSSSRPIVAIIGDGGLAMSAMEIRTAVTAGVDLGIILFNNACLGAIRNIQVIEYGEPYCTELNNPDYRTLSNSLGAVYFQVKGERWHDALDEFLKTDGVRLLEVRLCDSGKFKLHRRLSKMKSLVYESHIYDNVRKINNSL